MIYKQVVSTRLTTFAGGYTPFNDPPQGEVLVSGSNISSGYWKQPEKTAEDFVVIDGVRYFATGDIGEFREDGSLRIIGLYFPNPFMIFSVECYL